MICWEGATVSTGASFVQELQASPCLYSSLPANANFVLPIYPTRSSSRNEQDVRLPFSEPYDSFLLDGPNSNGCEEKNESNIVIEALESISGLSYRERSGDELLSSPSKRRQQSLTHREKSVRLLRQCSSWTQLENTMDQMRLQGMKTYSVLFYEFKKRNSVSYY